MGPGPPEHDRERRRRRNRRVLLGLVLAAVAGLIAALYIVPVNPVTRTATVWGHMESRGLAELVDDLNVSPPSSRCVSSSTPSSYLCTNIWYVFNWSTPEGQRMTFGLSAEGGHGQILFLYESQNSSFGGYVCYQGQGQCGYFFQFFTNDSSGFPWFVQEGVFYTYPTHLPLL